MVWRSCLLYFMPARPRAHVPPCLPAPPCLPPWSDHGAALRARRMERRISAARRGAASVGGIEEEW